MVVFDVPYVFEVFGGPKGLLEALIQHFPLDGFNYNQVQMWSQRRAIPPKPLACVLYVINKKGLHFAEFLTDPDEFA